VTHQVGGEPPDGARRPGGKSDPSAFPSPPVASQPGGIRISPNETGRPSKALPKSPSSVPSSVVTTNGTSSTAFSGLDRAEVNALVRGHQQRCWDHGDRVLVEAFLPNQRRAGVGSPSGDVVESGKDVIHPSWAVRGAGFTRCPSSEGRTTHLFGGAIRPAD
jgi:hypothetical protein